MVEEITVGLSRFKSLFVIARNSSFTFKGRAIDIKEIGRRLGVRYVLEGSVRKAAGKVRITEQLIGGEVLWSAAHLLEVDPAFTISSWTARGGQSNATLLTEGLRKRGCPNKRARSRR
jgi:adenylate cyclase